MPIRSSSQSLSGEEGKQKRQEKLEKMSGGLEPRNLCPELITFLRGYVNIYSVPSNFIGPPLPHGHRGE